MFVALVIAACIFVGVLVVWKQISQPKDTPPVSVWGAGVTHRPLIFVGLPAYRTTEYEIQTTIDSIFDQADASSNVFVGVFHTAAAPFNINRPRVRYLHAPMYRFGSAVAREKLLEMLTEDEPYVMLLHAHTLLFPHWDTMALRGIESWKYDLLSAPLPRVVDLDTEPVHVDVPVMFGCVERFSSKNDLIPVVEGRFAQLPLLVDRVDSPWVHSELIFGRREAVVAIHTHSLPFVTTDEDRFVTSLRAWCEGYRVGLPPKTLGVHFHKGHATPMVDFETGRLRKFTQTTLDAFFSNQSPAANKQAQFLRSVRYRRPIEDFVRWARLDDPEEGLTRDCSEYERRVKVGIPQPHAQLL